MSSIKIIKINKSLKNKKTLYKDILSSSETIKNILKKKKSLSNTLNSYNNIEKIEKCNSANSNSGYGTNSNSGYGTNSNSGYGENGKNGNGNSANSNNNTKNNIVSLFSNNDDRNDRNDRNIKKHLSKKNSVDFFRPKQHNNQNKNKYKSNNIKNYFQKKSVVIKIFTKDEIIRYIKVLNQFAYKDQYKIIHKYIRKLNKFQTIQILYALKLIKKKSNAPENLLKTMLFSYFTCYLTIIK